MMKLPLRYSLNHPVSVVIIWFILQENNHHLKDNNVLNVYIEYNGNDHPTDIIMCCWQCWLSHIPSSNGKTTIYRRITKILPLLAKYKYFCSIVIQGGQVVRKFKYHFRMWKSLKKINKYLFTILQYTVPCLISRISNARWNLRTNPDRFSWHDNQYTPITLAPQ